MSRACDEVVQGPLGVMAAPLARAGAGVCPGGGAWEFSNPRTLFLFSSYTIGKKRLYLEAARTLQCKARILAYMAITILSGKPHKTPG